MVYSVADGRRSLADDVWMRRDWGSGQHLAPRGFTGGGSWRLAFRYTLGIRSFNYVDETVYDRTSETLPAHNVDAELDVRQPRGSVHGGFHASQYLHDLSKHSLTLDGQVNFRVFRGLDFNMGGRVSRIKDQVYLPKEDLTPEEIFLRVQTRRTDFRHGLDVGLSFRFGSKFNNVVNPRMW